jgi:glucosamine--fructose-6-phosphate aminotransferase (isomerizing)
MTNIKQRYSESYTWNEILSQGGVWQTVLDEFNESPLVGEILQEAQTKREWVFVGCGTSFYLAEAAAISWTMLTGQPARAIPASEVLLYPKLLEPSGQRLQAVVISRSGRTSEALRAANLLRADLHVATLGITCAENSELGQICDRALLLRAADEKSTVMTRSFTSMLVTLQVLAARQSGNREFVKDVRTQAEELESGVMDLAERIETFVAQHTFADYVFLGQGPFHGVAREGALKVMEMSCSYSQFFHTLEFRHGPKAIVSPATCLTFFLSDTAQKAEAEVLAEMKELGGIVTAICNRAGSEVRKHADLVIELKFAGNELALLAPCIVPCQFLGFFAGLRKGLNPDQPKNLTRVVILD